MAQGKSSAVHRQAELSEGSTPEAGSGLCSHRADGEGGFISVSEPSNPFFPKGSRLSSSAFVSGTGMRKLLCEGAARTGRGSPATSPDPKQELQNRA